MSRRSDTLLSPGHPEWTPLAREKRAMLRPSADASVEELLRRGMRLSAEAGRLVRAVDRGADGRAGSAA